MVTVTGGPGTITGWDNPEERRQFYLRMLPTAQKWSAKTGIPVSVYLAINAHESNFGKSDALFGIKGSGPKGSQNLATWEAGPNGERININDSFRAYNSDDEAYADFHNLISQGRYAPAWQQYLKDHDAIGLLNGIVGAGYATDKNWGNKIGQVANRFQQEMQQFGIDPGKPAPQANGGAPTASPYAFPVQGYQGQVQLHWGEDRGASDIFAPAGTPVVAMVDGTIESAGYSEIGGNNVTLRGKDGNLYYMAHLIGTPLVKAGQQVTQGTPLGGVGDTGNAKGKGAHLHIGIGPSIISGTGPKGGSGANFDAVGLLQNTLAGNATYNPTTMTGGAAMPTTPAFTYTSPYADQIAALRKQQADDQKKLADLTASGITRENATQAATLDAAIEARNGQILDLVKIDQNERQFAWEQHQATVGQQANAATGIAGLRQQGFENSRGIIGDIANIANTAFGQRLDLANLVNAVMEGNRAARLQELNTMLAMGQLDMAQAAMRFDVQERQQAAELAWTVQAAAKAGWIADEERKNAMMFLPEGTHFQPGFEPNGAINATFAKWGIPPMVIGVAEVDRSRFDPETNLLRGANAQTAMGAPRPQFDTSETTASADRVRGIAGTDVSLDRIAPSQLNLPAPMNADSLIDRLPQNPNTADIESFLDGLMNPDVGVPPGVSATPPPPANTNPTNAPLGPNATGFINAEAQTMQANQQARDTVEAAAKPAGLARRDVAGIPVVNPNAPTPADRLVNPGAALIAGQTNAPTIPRGPTKPLDENDDITDTIWNWLTKKRSVKGLFR